MIGSDRQRTGACQDEYTHALRAVPAGRVAGGPAVLRSQLPRAFAVILQFCGSASIFSVVCLPRTGSAVVVHDLICGLRRHGNMVSGTRKRLMIGIAAAIVALLALAGTTLAAGPNFRGFAAGNGNGNGKA